VLAHRKERDAEDARAALAGEERSKREALEEQARQQRQRLRAMSLVALVCLALAGFAAWQLRVAREATRRAEEERQGAQYSQFVAQEARKEAERRQIEANEQREIADGARVEAEKQAAAATASAADAEKAKQLAEQQARVAYSRELAAATVPFIEPTSQDELAILLALQAVGTTYNVDGTVTREAEDVLRRAVGAASLPLAFPGHTAAINAIAFSSSGSEVATCSADGTARVWNATTGEQRQSISVGKCDGLTFGADGLRLVRSEFGGREVDVADAMSGGLLLELRLPRGEQVQDFVLSANGRWLATNHVASGLRIWPIERDSRATQVPVVEETRRSQAVALSANGRRLAYAQENSVHIADLEPTRPVRSITTRNLANTIALSLDGSLLAVSTGTAGVQVLEVSSEREIATVPVERPEDLVFSPPDGRYLAALTTDGISLWETASGKPVRTITGRRKIAFSPDGQRLAVSTGVTSVEITELTSGKTVAELFGRQESEIRRVALSPNGKFVVTSSQDRRLTVWDAVSGRSTMTVRLESGALLAAVASAGDRVVGHRRGEPLSIWRQGQPTPIVTEDRLGELFDLRFVAGGKRVVTGGRQGERLLTIWDTESGQATEARYAPSRDDVGRVRAIAFSDDEQRVAVATNVSTTVSDTTSGKILFEVDKPWNDIVLAGSTGQWLALSDGNSTVVWDVNTRTRVGEIAAGVNPGLAGMRLPRLAMRDAGRTVAVVDKGDQTVSLWDARNGSRLSTLYRHGGNVLTLAFVEGGTRLRVVADDWTVHDHPVDIRRLMTLAQTRVKRPLTVDECKKYLSLPSCPAR
jgi:WD40 repeat protein